MGTNPTDPTPEKGPDWEARFLRTFAKTGIVAQACKAARIDRSTAYEHRRSRPEFAQAWRDAEEDACDVLEQRALERGEKGSDTLTIFLLKARNPAKFRDETLSVQRVMALFEGMLEILRAEVSEPDARRTVARIEREVIGSLANGHGKTVVDPSGHRD